MLQLVFLFGLGLSFSATAVNTVAHVTPVVLDGEDISVYFNDGDTFKILSGHLKNTRARLKGFNALESYGPVHSWGDWTTTELYQIANDATYNARNGSWHCLSEGAKDTYGRILVSCHDLAKDQIQKGFAHVMTVNQDENNEELLKIQQEAIRSRLGMWKKGFIDYILTSTHSALEKELTGKAYDRFVSVKNGKSAVRTHHNDYQACEMIAYTPDEKSTASSMIYIPFQQRYGLTQAVCLRNVVALPQL